MTDNAIATRDDAPAAVAVPIPAVLRELGVRIAEDAASGNRLVLIPSEVRQRVNVIDPVTSLVQADPNWTPRVSVAELNPDPDNGPHFYKQAGGKLAPTKQALEVLAKAAGILSTTTERIPRAELDDGEIGYRATVTIRRSDGTTEQVQREKVWVKEAERAEIEDAVRNARTKRWQHGDDAEIEKRWLKELRDRYAKTESKAVLRAIRAALQMPHTFTPQDAAKPFLIIGFNFTPDYNDVETRRMLVAAGLNAQAAVYGPRALDDSEPRTAGGGSESGPQAGLGGGASAAGPAPGDDDDEPEPGAPAAAAADPELEARIAAAGETVIDSDQRRGQTIASVVAESAAGDEAAQDWLLWALSPRRMWHRQGKPIDAALDLYVQHRDPALWERSVEANRIDGQ